MSFFLCWAWINFIIKIRDISFSSLVQACGWRCTVSTTWRSTVTTKHVTSTCGTAFPGMNIYSVITLTFQVLRKFEMFYMIFLITIISKRFVDKWLKTILLAPYRGCMPWAAKSINLMRNPYHHDNWWNWKDQYIFVVKHHFYF